MDIKSREEILTKAIEKAIANGFDMGKTMGHRRPNDSFELYTDPRLTHWIKYENGEGMVYWLIFNHDFAKALWGKEGTIEQEFRTRDLMSELYKSFKNKQAIFNLKSWQYHLQQMIIADDPIAYLGENL